MLELLELETNFARWSRAVKEVRETPDDKISVNIYNNTIWFHSVGIAIVKDCQSDGGRIKHGTCLVLNTLYNRDKSPALFTLSRFESIILTWKFSRLVSEVKRREAIYRKKKEIDQAEETVAETWKQTARILKDIERDLNGKKGKSC